MNFTYDGTDLSKSIKKYIKNGNNYTINYLDGTSTSYFNSLPDEEEKIKSIMLQQVIERQQKFNTKELLRKKYINLLNSIISLSGTIIGLEKREEILLIILFLILGFSFYNYVDSNIKLKELKKYKIFLELVDDLDKVNNSNFLKCIEFDNFYQKPFDINTLDEYSYSEVKTIYKNYKKTYKK